MWLQTYDPLGNSYLSTAVASVPVMILLGAIAVLQVPIHVAALLGLAAALGIALFVYHMPIAVAFASAGYGAAYGLLPIGWIIVNVIFLYQLTLKNGSFSILRDHLMSLVPDRRIQLILIAYSFGAFFEGAAGFGTPVAISASILMQLGFKPIQACSLALIANSAPVAYGALGTPIVALSGVSGIDVLKLSAMCGRQLMLFSVIIPFWIVWVYSGFRSMLQVWPAALVAGVGFAIPQLFVSNYHGPWLVDVIASIVSMLSLALLLRFWRPSEAEVHDGARASESVTSLQGGGEPAGGNLTSPQVAKAWLPWALLSVMIFLWGLPEVKQQLNSLSEPQFSIPALHHKVVRNFPVVPSPTTSTPTKPEEAVFKLSWLSSTGTAILFAAIVSGLLMKFSPRQLFLTYAETVFRIRYSLLTIVSMLALGYITRYSGTDATLGLALAQTGFCYPFFGTLLGWLGVAITGSDTASNVLFGSLQKLTAGQIGVSDTLMVAANCSGGGMGKIVAGQSIVVATTATDVYGHEGSILRAVFFHSLALACLVAVLVLLQAYVYPFTQTVVR